MQGFFTKKDIKSKSRPGGKTLSCASCGLLENTLNPAFGVTGKGRKKIMVIGDSNSKAEDERRKHWQGMEGRFFKQQLESQGIDLYEDCWSVNAVSCVTEKPTSAQIECCRKTLRGLIKDKKPRLIFVLGLDALYSMIGDIYFSSLGEFSKWRGFVIPSVEHNSWLCPIFHPKEVLEARPEKLLIWQQDLANALTYIKTTLPTYTEPEIEYIKDLSILNEIEDGTYVSIDYETTGLKPHADGHKIVCASVAVTPDKAYVFMIPESRKELKPFLQLLRNPNIYKMAHNMKYEEQWSAEILKTSVRSWAWDSMIAAHVIDNRRGVCGLKFQTFLHFGIGDYSSDISPYLKSDSKDSNSLNTVLEFTRTGKGRKKLMEYCALDTIYQYRLAEIQKNFMSVPFK